VSPGVLVLAGTAQLVLSAASLAIPRVLGWRAELRALPPLTRQVFWTYAAYVWGAHVAFAALSLMAPEWLLGGSGPARGVAAFVSLWWGARLLVAALGCERRELPRTPSVRAAHVVLLCLFAALTAVYGLAAAGVPA
jgi:hypothetical protein